jgi:hypothetical protein
MYYCGDDFIGSLGTTIEEAFTNYQVNVDHDVDIGDCMFYKIESNPFFCTTKIVIND